MAIIWLTILLIPGECSALAEKEKGSGVGIPVGGWLNFTCPDNHRLVFTDAQSSRILGIHRHLNDKCKFEGSCAIKRRDIVSTFNVEVANNLIVSHRCVLAQALSQSCSDVNFTGKKDSLTIITSVDYPIRDKTKDLNCTFELQVPSRYMLTLTIVDCYEISVFMNQQLLCNGSTEYGTEILLHSSVFLNYNVPASFKGGLLSLITSQKVIAVASDGAKDVRPGNASPVQNDSRNNSDGTLLTAVVAPGAIVSAISIIAVYIICKKKRPCVMGTTESGVEPQVHSHTAGTMAGSDQILERKEEHMREAKDYGVPACSLLDKVDQGKYGPGELERESKDPKKVTDEGTSDIKEKANAGDGKRGVNSAGYAYSVVDVKNLDHLEKPNEHTLENLYQEIQEKGNCNKHDSGSISYRMPSVCSNIYQDIPEHDPMYMTLEAT